uniref:NADH-ubiquinone oxidoreductase chain 2 n=1 Tax=Hydroporus planus TaxID=107871 RepID=A0A191ZQU1_9DYTI|nr:NADH dehydrogenase subunit 2 [Hydroporus planus]ANJ70239.1 NADH dehydrogenase subunit 2 [Hydroporus planus]QRV62699.1 NADH dehydrogenase subunit 2 [Hydroporus planus]
MFFIYKLMFISMLFMGTIITISSYSWLGVWMGLEINLLSFIPLINMKNNQYSSESSIKYFLIQALASSILLFTIIMLISKSKMINEMFFFNKTLMMIMNSTILLKLGAAPFHFWFPEIIEGLNWMNSLILMTWQKIAPMMILSYTMKINYFIYMIIIMSTLIGSIGGLNQTSLRKILAYSSINHIGWMLTSFLMNEIIWIIYFMIYSFISLSIILMFNKFNIFMLNQLFMMMNNFYIIKYFMLMNLLSLGGLPPFMGFLPKWIIIQNLSYNNFLLITFMIMMTLITLFFYLRISYSSLMINNNELNFLMIMNKNNYNNMIINLMSFISIYGMILYTMFINFY